MLSFDKDKATGSTVLAMKLVGADVSATAKAEEKLPGTSNYIRGNDRSKWATEVPTFEKVKYTGVYPGVDLVFYGNQRELECDFVVAPGRDAGQNALEFAGAEPVVDASGDLLLGRGGVQPDGGAKFSQAGGVPGGQRGTGGSSSGVRGSRAEGKFQARKV